MSYPPPARGRSRTRSPIDEQPAIKLSQSPVSRERSYTPRSPKSPHRARSPMRSRSRSRSPVRGRGRSYSPRAGSKSRSRSRSSRGRPADRTASRSVSRSRSRSRRRSRSRSGSRGVFRSSKIVIEKLTKNVTEDHIREIFGVYGDIKFVDMPTNPHFHTNRGLCYLLYHSPSSASAAIAHMHESQLDGSTIEVSIVIPRRIPGSGGMPNPSGPPMSGPGRFRGAGGPGGRYRSPPRRAGHGVGGGRAGAAGGGFAGRGGDSYRPKSRSRSVSRSRSYSSRSRSPSRSRSRSPYRSRKAGKRKGRSASYSSYSSRSASRSRSRSKGRKHSRSRSRDRRGVAAPSTGGRRR
ncbi:hypothetical protein DFH27DRAFT_613022 [Peziza echinospora]|nr:hypothetical protein DFH27DRAFT_613022 [Peziza echinospora]